jgi:hypothetical protein
MLPFRLLFGTVIAWAIAGAAGLSPASACNPGEFTCSGGYKSTCKCWTVSGCNFEPDGLCQRDEPRDMQSRLSPAQAALVSLRQRFHVKTAVAGL